MRADARLVKAGRVLGILTSQPLPPADRGGRQLIKGACDQLRIIGPACGRKRPQSLAQKTRSGRDVGTEPG